MSTTTDPARELAFLCERLAVSADARGDDFLASQFQVKAWSSEFYQIVFCILQQCDQVAKAIDDLDIDEDIRQQAVGHINSIKQAFGRASLSRKWNDSGGGAALLKAEHIGPIKTISPLVRQKISFPRLSDEERDDLIKDVDQLLEWLSAEQTGEPDFIRQGLLDGLQAFRFRLVRLNWVGWGYTLDSLRDVITAYLFLARDGADPNTFPNAQAALRMVGSLVGKVYEKLRTTNEALSVFDMGVRLYGYGALFLTGANAMRLLPSS